MNTHMFIAHISHEHVGQVTHIVQGLGEGVSGLGTPTRPQRGWGSLSGAFALSRRLYFLCMVVFMGIFHIRIFHCIPNVFVFSQFHPLGGVASGAASVSCDHLL